MPVTQEFEYTWPEGSTPIQFHTWIATLSQSEQDEFAQAFIRQRAYRQQAIDSGLMSLRFNGYEWKDKATLDRGKPTDPVWQAYWQRWIDTTGVQFIVNIVEV